MSDAERIEQYQYLRREQAKNMRYFGVSVIGLILCLSVASGEGPSGGWPWSLGAIFFLFIGLWSFIEARYFDLRIALHMLPNDIRNDRN